ncbi:hypothetical protein FRC06_005473 [Ceratobasidium sp. 370]|nr:hypothetical protein FRC06_005473 [Ceratobasidium sp. 370]
MSGNHFLRSMDEPVTRSPESTTDDPTPEVRFAETVSVVTEVNNLAEAPLVDVPLELTTADDVEGADANEQIRRSASRDRDMKDEEGLVLKAIPREPSEETGTTAQTAEVVEGVENLEIASNSNAAKKRKQKAEENPDVPAAVRNHPAFEACPLTYEFAWYFRQREASIQDQERVNRREEARPEQDQRCCGSRERANTGIAPKQTEKIYVAMVATEETNN